MKFLKQNRLHLGMEPVQNRGNCMPTVIACFLDLDSPEDAIQIQEHFDESDWHVKLINWLDERGWMWEGLFGHLTDDTYYLVIGETIRGTKHVCIYQNGKLVHDPHPSDAGLITEEYFEILYKTIV